MAALGAGHAAPTRSKAASVKPAAKGSKASQHATKAKAPPAEERDGPWELRSIDARKWGEKLRATGGSGANSIKHLLKTLGDSRSLSEVSLRRTAVQALVPAAAVGHRGALAAQAAALTDGSDVVRRNALESLRVAAGGVRPQRGGAVAVALGDALPPKNSSYSYEARRRGADALLRLAPHGDAHLAATAAAWLTDEDAKVRCSATRALGYIGAGLETIDGVAARLQDTDWRVSRAAVDALEQLATGEPPPGRRLSAASLGEGEDDDGPSPKAKLSRRSAVGFMKNTMRSSRSAASASAGGSKKNTLRPPPDAESAAQKAALKAAAEALAAEQEAQHETKASVTRALAASCSEGALFGLVRSEAMAALARSAEPGDEQALHAAAARLTDLDDAVRHQAVQTVAALAPGDRTTALRASAQHLADIDYRIRAAAGRAMVAATSPTNVGDQAFAIAAARLEGLDWRSRRGAATVLKALGDQARAADEDGVMPALHALVPRLHHTDWSVRRKAVEAVAVVAEAAGGSRLAVDLLEEVALDGEEEVRLAVATVLPAAAPRKCKQAVAVVARYSTNVSEPLELRLRALAAIEQLASESRSRSRTAVQFVLECLPSHLAEVRSASARVLSTIGRGRRTSVDLLTGCLEHVDEQVRLTAARAFPGIVGEQKERALRRTLPLLQHSSAGVRAATTEAVASFSSAAPEAQTAMAAAAGVLARYRRDRLVDEIVAAGSAVGEGEELSSARGSEAARSAGNASRLSLGSRAPVPAARRGSDAGRSAGGGSRGSRGSRGSGGRGVAPQAAPGGPGSAAGGSAAGASAEGSGGSGRGSQTGSRAGSTAGAAASSKLDALLRGDVAGAAAEEKARRRALEEEDARAAQLAELEELERQERERVFSESETDDEEFEDEESEDEDEEEPAPARSTSYRDPKGSGTRNSFVEA